MQKISTQKIIAILKKAGFKKGGWAASSRVKGWGSAIRGFEVLGDTHLTYSERKIRGQWRTYREQSGKFAITWNIGEHKNNQDNREEILKEIGNALVGAGIENVKLDLEGKIEIITPDSSYTRDAKVVVNPQIESKY